MMERKKYCLLLFAVITFFCVFDGMRSNIVYNQVLSPLKELSVLLCFIECLKQRKIQFRYVLGIPFFLFMTYHFIIGLISVFQIDALSMSNTILMIFKFSLIYLTICCFYSFENLTGKPFEVILKWIVYAGVVYTVINVVSIFIHIPIWINNDIWFGRFSKGYPTSDTISLCVMLIIVLFNPLRFKNKKRVLLIMVAIVSIAMQNTGSGLILLPFIVLVYFLGQCYNKKLKNVFSFVISLIIAIVIIGKFVTSINHTIAQKVEDASLVFQAKIDNFVKGEETENFNSISARQDQEKAATKFVEDDVDRFFGIGFGHFTMSEKMMNSRAFSIENMASNIKIIYGYCGYILFCLSIFSFLVFIYKWQVSLNIKLFYCCGIAVFVVGCMALVSFYLIQVYGTFALFIGMLKHKTKLNV